MRCSLLICLAVSLSVPCSLLPTEYAIGADSLVQNGSFEKWTDKSPNAWTIEIGATNGAKTPQSEVKQIKGPALMLRGSTSTMAWSMLSQKIAAQVGTTYALAFESQTKNIKRERNQFDNCYVGVMYFDSSGKLVDRKFQDASADTDDWTKHVVRFTVPPQTAMTKIVVFLSKTGILGVKNISVTTSGSNGATMKRNEVVVNGDFSKWSRDLPTGWKASIAARNGADAPTSAIGRANGTGVTLAGNASTLAWYSLSQELNLRKGISYALSFEAQAKGIRREGQQFNNCYVGLMFLDSHGKRLDMSIEDLSGVTQSRQHRLDFTVPANATTAQLLIFLSKTGILTINNVQVKEATPKRPFRRSR